MGERYYLIPLALTLLMVTAFAFVIGYVAAVQNVHNSCAYTGRYEGWGRDMSCRVDP